MRTACSGLLGLLLMLPVQAVCADEVTKTVEVTIQNYTFEPAKLHIKAGTTVVWNNRERRVSHSIQMLGADSFESERFFPDESWQHTFNKAGTYHYSCGPHPQMHGTIIVEE